MAATTIAKKAFIAECMANPRLKGLVPNGTRPLDMRVFQQVLTESLKDKVIQTGVEKPAGAARR